MTSQFEVLKQILQHTKGIIWAIDRQYCLLFANETYQNTLIASGVNAMQLGQNVLTNEYPQDFLDFWKTNYDKCFLGEEFIVESHFYSTDGIHFVENSLSPIKDNEGSIVGVVVVSIDNTEIKFARKNIIESESKYRYLFENMISGFQLSEVFVDENNQPIDFNFIDGNKNMKQFTGYDIEEIRGKTIKQILPNADINMIRKYGNVALTGEPFTMEYFSNTFKRHFHVSCYCPKKGFFVAVFDDISERKALEEASRKNEAENRAIIQALPDLMLRIHRDGTFLDFLSTDESLLIAPKETLTGKNIHQILPPNVVAQSLEAIEKAIASNEVVSFEYQLDIQGKDCHFENRFIAISEHEVLSIIRDISQRKEAENEIVIQTAALAESESMFSQFMDYLPGVAFLKDHEGRLIFTNKYMIEVLGAKDWLGKAMVDLFPNEFGQQLTIDDKNSLAKGYLRIEESVPDVNGEHHIYETQKFRIDRQGKEPLLGGISLDVTERKIAEQVILQAKEDLAKQVEIRTSELRHAKEAAEKNEEKFKDIFNLGNDPMFVRQLDKDGNFSILIDVNEIACEKYGYTRAEFLNMHPSDLVDPVTFINKDLPALKELIEKRKVTFESLHLTKEGKEMNVELSGRYFELEGKNVLLYIIRDITDRKKAEKAAIESQRLMAVGEMAASVAHDFNNSLQAMLGYIEIIKFKGNLAEATIGYLKIIETLLADVSSRVKLMQRFGDNKQGTDNHQLINVNPIISEVILQLRPIWKDKLEKEGKHIHIDTAFSKSLYVQCNEGEIKTAIHNIIKNSLEAMPEGGNLTIATHSKGRKAIITFTDTGIGMNEETKSKIFQPFYSTKGFEAGRGLGMSGVYSIVKSYGGDIYVVSSEIGSGTTIEMTFPYNKQQEKLEEMITKEQLHKKEAKLNILWVEDDDIIRTSIIELINIIGHQCDTANSGQQALEFLEQNTYDIVLTDIGMPEMSGWQLADAIKEKYKGTIPVCVVSGWQINEQEKQEHGVKYSIGKPFSIAEINNLLFTFRN